MPDSSLSLPPFAQAGVVDARPRFTAALDHLLKHRGLPPSQPLSQFRALERRLSLSARLELVDQALILMRDFYVNRPLKEALQAALPIRRLELLRLELERLRDDGEVPPPLEFHAAMTEIFTSVYDRHVRYFLPEPDASACALLGFDVEAFFDRGRDDPAAPEPEPRYMVTRVFPGAEESDGESGFGPGALVETWNGIDIARAVELNGDRHAGANRAARHARAVTRLTVRPLRTSPLPDEDWVVIGYRRPEGGEVLHLALEWRVAVEVSPATISLRQRVKSRKKRAVVGGRRVSFATHATDDAGFDTTLEESLDEEAAAVGELRRILDCGTAEAVEPPIAREGAGDGGPYTRRVLERLGDESRMPEVMKAMPIAFDDEGGPRRFGLIRIYTFDRPASHAGSMDEFVDAFVAEFVRLLQTFREVHEVEGLILDVRDNGGGQIRAGEEILQTLTPRRIEPERFEFLSNPTTLAFCRLEALSRLEPWADSLALSAKLGAPYSRGFPLSSPERCNRIGQVFFKPTVLIVNALSYSTTDILAAGFQDHAIGPVLAADGNVGAGGANTVSHAKLCDLWKGGPLRPLPSRHGTGRGGMQIAIRRALRVGERVGTPLEELGIEADERHYMTARDLLYCNTDLINHAIDVLLAQPTLQVEGFRREGDSVSVDVRTTSGSERPGAPSRIARIGVRYADPDGSSAEAPVSGSLPAALRVRSPDTLRVEAFDRRDRLVANESVGLTTRLDLRVDPFVDYFACLWDRAAENRLQSDLDAAAAAIRVHRDAVRESSRRDPQSLDLVDYAVGASHTESLRWRLRRAGVPDATVEPLCDALAAGERIHELSSWRSHRKRIERAIEWLRRPVLARQRELMEIATRWLDYTDIGVRAPVYLVGHLNNRPRSFGSKRLILFKPTRRLRLAPFVVRVMAGGDDAGQRLETRRQLATTLLRGALFHLRVAGDYRSSRGGAEDDLRVQFQLEKIAALEALRRVHDWDPSRGRAEGLEQLWAGRGDRELTIESAVRHLSAGGGKDVQRRGFS